MKKMIVFAALALAGCNATIEDQERDMAYVADQLPDGCVLTYAGKVRVKDHDRASRIFVTQCEARNATTTSEQNSVSQGKTNYEQSNVTITTD